MDAFLLIIYVSIFQSDFQVMILVFKFKSLLMNGINVKIEDKDMALEIILLVLCNKTKPPSKVIVLILFIAYILLLMQLFQAQFHN